MTYEIHGVIPRCLGCRSHSNYIIINKDTNEKKHFCKICADLYLHKYSKESWEIIDLN